MPVSIRWFPPSWLLIKAGGEVIYIDPAWVQKNFEHYPKKVIYSHYPEPMDGLPEADLPIADIILVTHHHQDHVKTATLARLAGDGTRIFAPPACAGLVGKPFTPIGPGSEYDVTGIKIRAVHACNTPQGNSTRKVHHRGECVGYLLTAGGKTLYHAGDTDLIPEMGALGSVDAAFLPIGGTFTMDVREAAQAVAVIRPKIAVPMHYLKASAQEFRQLVETGTEAEAVALETGGTIEL